jgi:hypothetical protein
LDHIKQEDAKRKQKNLALAKTSSTAHVDPQHLETIFGKKFLFSKPFIGLMISQFNGKKIC